MSIKYYDSISGRERYKPRYAWAFHGYVLGLITGATFFLLLLG